jgi:adenylate cyclase
VPIRSYRSAFILLFTVLLVLTTAAVGYNAYRRASAVSLGLSADIIDQMAEKVTDRTVAILQAAYGYLEMNALVVPRQGLAADRDQVFRLFWRQLELSPQLLSIFAAEPSGGFLQVRDNPQLVTRYIDRGGPRPREQLIYRDQDYAPIAHIEGGGLFDPRETAWYIGALAAQGSVTWSSVYRFTSVQKPGVTAAKTVYGDDGKPVLVLGVDIALEGLSDFISDQPLAKGAVAMIVDDRDRLVAYPFHLKLKAHSPDRSDEDLPMVSELADPALVHAYELLKSSTSGEEGQRTQSSGPLQGFEVTRTGGVSYIARIHHFPSHWTEGWKLFVVVPEASLLTAAERLLSESAVISLIILAIALFLVSLLALRLFKPLRKLVKNTELVRQMRLSEVEPVHSNFSEIQSMSAALCGMKQGLETLEKFVPATVFQGLIETGAEVRPEAEVRELVLVCGGMAQLGGLCRLLPAERISAILTEQLDGLTRVLVRLGATVDDYLGESLLAFWGAPKALGNDAARACRAVLQCLQTGAELAGKDDAYPTEMARILFAVHSGPCIVGNIGSQRYLAYTAVGDNVELTWRLKQINRVYGTRAIVTAPVREAVGGDFWLRWLDRLPMPDGGAPLDLFELQGERAVPLSVETQLFSRAYERGLEALLAGRFESADETFASLQSQRPDDPALRLMRRRCSARSALACMADEAIQPPEPAGSPGAQTP